MTDSLNTITANMAVTPKVSEMLNGFSQVFGVMGEAVRHQENQYEQKIGELQANQVQENTNIIATGKRKEMVALLNALYESSVIDKENISKADFFARAAIMMGDPGLKDYATSLSQEVQTNKYDNIFDDFKKTAIEYRTTTWEKQKNLR